MQGKHLLLLEKDFFIPPCLCERFICGVMRALSLSLASFPPKSGFSQSSDPPPTQGRRQVCVHQFHNNPINLKLDQSHKAGPGQGWGRRHFVTGWLNQNLGGKHDSGQREVKASSFC